MFEKMFSRSRGLRVVSAVPHLAQDKARPAATFRRGSPARERSRI